MFLNYLDSRNINYSIPGKNVYDFDSVKLYLLNDEIKSEYNFYNVLNRSLPIKLKHGNNDLLFTGGLEIRGEKVLIESFDDFLDADVIQIANNGSNVSSSTGFLKTVNPYFAVINNNLGNYFNNPSEDVLARLTMLNSNTLRTDL
ncbi:MAG: hypothetical protein U5K00_03105 [Melioribacteraceae bacterium]|nr:hypothetical protein [Melioribacteraceae bacterium]